MLDEFDKDFTEWDSAGRPTTLTPTSQSMFKGLGRG